MLRGLRGEKETSDELMKSWGCSALIFLPNSLREFGKRALSCPPLVKAVLSGCFGG
jgi:hypothetical protein